MGTKQPDDPVNAWPDPVELETILVLVRTTVVEHTHSRIRIDDIFRILIHGTPVG